MPKDSPAKSGLLVHGDNLLAKEGHRTKYRDEESRRFLLEIRPMYDEWKRANTALVGPRLALSGDDVTTLGERVRLLEEYKDFLDQQHYAEKFDSRSNLHSSVLEEFLYFLFRDLVADFGDKALIGKSHAFKDMFFVPPGYRGMLERPHAVIEKKDHDFVIGINVEVAFQTRVPTAGPAVRGRAKPAPEPSLQEGEVTVVDTDPVHDEDSSTEVAQDVVLLRGEQEIHTLDVPAVAIECKTYLDKTMLEGSSRAAEDLKGRVPTSLYIVVMEWIKLSDAINPEKFKVDQIYVLRQDKNVDREFRYAETYVKKPISLKVVRHLFQTVRNHLASDWEGGIQHAIERGWLVNSKVDEEIEENGEQS
jgi:hypothetical protein